MSRKIRFGPSPLKLKSRNLRGEAVYDAFHLPGPSSSSLVGSLGEVSIVLTLPPRWSRGGTDVGDTWRGE